MKASLCHSLTGFYGSTVLVCITTNERILYDTGVLPVRAYSTTDRPGSILIDTYFFTVLVLYRTVQSVLFAFVQ